MLDILLILWREILSWSQVRVKPSLWMGRDLYCIGIHPRGVATLLVASFHRIWVKLRSDGALGSSAGLTLFFTFEANLVGKTATTRKPAFSFFFSFFFFFFFCVFFSLQIETGNTCSRTIQMAAFVLCKINFAGWILRICERCLTSQRRTAQKKRKGGKGWCKVLLGTGVECNRKTFRPRAQLRRENEWRQHMEYDVEWFPNLSAVPDVWFDSWECCDMEYAVIRCSELFKIRFKMSQKARSV